MVRFIMFTRNRSSPVQLPFTFQYGQIYYQNIANQTISDKLNLHSNMVRFIIEVRQKFNMQQEAFTFQYGQIYYYVRKYGGKNKMMIYIPIWLDLLCSNEKLLYINYDNLHSNMVRFIMKSKRRRRNDNIWIYIPIWLDLLSRN